MDGLLAYQDRDYNLALAPEVPQVESRIEIAIDTRCAHFDYPYGAPPIQHCILPANHDGAHLYRSLEKKTVRGGLSILTNREEAGI